MRTDGLFLRIHYKSDISDQYVISSIAVVCDRAKSKMY